MKMSKSESGKLGSIKSTIASHNKRNERINEYNLNPILCKCCGKPILYDKRINKYCSRSCSTKINNTLFQKRPAVQINNCIFCGKETKNEKYCSHKCQMNHKLTIKINNTEYSIVYFKKCKCCNLIFTAKKLQSQKCNKCKELYGNSRSELMMKRAPYFF